MSTRSRRPAPPAHPDIIVGCRTPAHAVRMARSLTLDAGLYAVTTDDRLVRVPWDGSEEFIRTLFAQAVEKGYVEERTAALALRHRLRATGRAV